MRANPDTEKTPWQPIPLGAAAGLSLLAAWILWQHFFTADAWVFLLDHANLALHEAGHPVIGIVSSRLAVYGGTIFQLLFPMLCAHHFWRGRQAAGWAASLLWLADSMLNIGRYMKDARAQVLPLVGSGDHDWTEIFSRWGVLAHDVRIGNGCKFLGLMLAAYAVWWIWRRRRQAGTPVMH
ncbi:hypothetical protein GCM10027277_01720 [Pseudoduganella ginsengisoli]|uniref:Uncharacterized protein n=1 Tax=Pseudoduganella ginsengisoli TaxID=1462440 RepID=A0A6L6Q7U6_9BURK|nr:hypothetical protein [Pseudoduganella ginsengisoli]MTW05847.1 hypothetical protein [Pseudoduganella ginsengisoli]